MTPIKNSHKVTIFKQMNFLANAQEKSNPDFFAQAKESIGSYFEKSNSPKVATGLSADEERLLMPKLLGVSAADRDFEKMVKEFFNELTTPVGTNGTELEIGLLKDNNEPISETNMPIDVSDYVRYRHVSKHPWVAGSKEDGKGNMTKKWYIFDKEKTSNLLALKSKNDDAAMAIYLKIKDKKEEVGQMLTLLNIDIRTFDNTEKGTEAKQLKLKALLEEDSVNFVQVYETGDLEIRSWIQRMLDTNTAKKINGKFVDTATNETIGNSLDEVIDYFKNPDNSTVVDTFKGRVQEAMLKPADPNIKRTVL